LTTRRFVDLHTHSNASDGSFSPEELIRHADAARLAAVALTDHDTVVGLSRARSAASALPQLRFVNGIELSAKFPGGTLHILGYAIDETAAALRDVCDRLLEARRERNPKMLALLQGLGLDIDISDVLAAADPDGGAADGPRFVGRLHFAEALRRKGFTRSIGESFERYLVPSAPAFVDKERLSAAEAIAAIHGAGGVAVLAHPQQLNCADEDRLRRALRGMIDDGLDGIEVYHTTHTPQETRLYLNLAREHGLGITGGSDFHGPILPGAYLAHPPVPLAAVQADFPDIFVD